MVKRFLIAAFIIAIMCSVSFADVQSWQDPKFDFASLNKILVMPPYAELKAGTGLKPSRRQAQDLIEWAKEGVRTAYKKRSGTLIVKGYDDLVEDMRFIYGDDKNWSDSLFYQRASEMGYNVFISMNVTQEFKTEHIPESVRTYTEYREIEKRDRHGRLIEVIRIPEERTEIIPAHDVTYLHTTCEPALYLTEDSQGDYVSIVDHDIYREYQGGPVLGVVENIIKSSVSKLLEHNDKPQKTRPGTRVIKRKK